MAITPVVPTPSVPGGKVSVGGRGVRITRPFEDLREKDEKKKDDGEDAKRKHEPRR